MTYFATGASLAGSAFGIYQGITGQKKADQAKDRLEKLAKNSPIYKPDKSIHDYYQQALNRYNENPYTSPYYLESIKQSNRAAANALGSMQSRGAAIGTVGKINQGTMDNANRAIAGAVQNKNSQFSQLGNASSMQASQTAKAFDINQLTPYKTQLGLNELQMSAGNELANTGWQNAAAGVANIGALGAKGLYKKN